VDRDDPKAGRGSPSLALGWATAAPPDQFWEAPRGIGRYKASWAPRAVERSLLWMDGGYPGLLP
jgi:hypothetical protein